jgi:formamidopyrimidine-DNA glycosylase
LNCLSICLDNFKLYQNKGFFVPELPEVETTLKGIEPYLTEFEIESVTVRNGSLRWPVSQKVHQLQHQKIQKVTRRGKYIIIHFDIGAILIHLGMSGNLRVVEPDMPVKKHDHVDLMINSGKIIRFNDPRRFGCVLWADEWSEHKLIQGLGVEPLTELLTGKYLHSKAKGKKTSIKQFIMNGKLVVGVGNIYANEALFLAGIQPTRVVSKVSLKSMNLLVDCIKRVLSEAIVQGGTTLKDFVGSDGKPGYFKQQLNVYGRAGESCYVCKETLQEIRQNNRSSVYCSRCQT